VQVQYSQTVGGTSTHALTYLSYKPPLNFCSYSWSYFAHEPIYTNRSYWI